MIKVREIMETLKAKVSVVEDVENSVWKRYKISFESSLKCMDKSPCVMTISSCKLAEFDDYVDVFNRRESTSVFAQLFEDRNSLRFDVAKELFVRYGTDILLFDTVFVLEHVSFEKHYCYSTAFQSMLEMAFEALGINDKECAFLVNPLPQNYECDESDDDTMFKVFDKHNSGLSALFQSFGFLELMSQLDGSILIHNTALKLKYDQGVVFRYQRRAFKAELLAFFASDPLLLRPSELTRQIVIEKKERPLTPECEELEELILTAIADFSDDKEKFDSVERKVCEVASKYKKKIHIKLEETDYLAFSMFFSGKPAMTMLRCLVAIDRISKKMRQEVGLRIELSEFEEFIDDIKGIKIYIESLLDEKGVAHE
jgi:hypothetical protein